MASPSLEEIFSGKWKTETQGMDIIYDFQDNHHLTICSFMGDMQTTYTVDNNVVPHTIDIAYAADPQKGIKKDMTLKAYYKFERGSEDILHMYTPQKMEPWRVAIEECEHLECRRFKEERKELPDHLKNLSEKERVLMAIKETADVMAEEFRNGQQDIEETEDGDMPKVNMESFTRIMSIPSKYGLTPLKIEEYKLKDDPDVTQAFQDLEAKMREAGAEIPDEEPEHDPEVSEERTYYMSPENRAEAQAAAVAASVPVPVASKDKPSSQASKTPSEPTAKDEKKVTVDTKPKSDSSSEKTESVEEKEKSSKRKKKTKQKPESDNSWLTYAAIAGALAAAAVLVYAVVKPRPPAK